MPRQKKGKARQQALAPEGGGMEGDLAPIPEDTNGYEGYDQYEQGGETWQGEENAWPEGGGYDDAYPQGGHFGDQPGVEAEPWDTGQYQQRYGPPTTSPANAPQPPGPSAFANWGRNPQDAYGAPRPPHMAPQPSPAQPPMTLPSRPRQGAAAGAPGWKNWSQEAITMAYNKNFVPPPQGGGYGQQNRVAFAGHDPYAPFEDRADATPQAQHMIYDSITSSRVGAPREPHQRPGRGPAQHSTHTGKHSKKSKKEKRAQGQSAPNGWGGQQDNTAWPHPQENPGWQENTQWDQAGYGFDQQGANWGEKQDPAADQWGAGQVGRDDLVSEGYTESDGWNDVTGRRNFRRTVSNAFVPAPAGNSPYPMPSRTMAYANGTLQDPLDSFSPGLSRQRNTMHDFADIELLESDGEALKPVMAALFGRDRKAHDRIHWQFPFDKDERVRHALEWLHDYAHGIGAFGLNKFLQTRERGALFINASYDSPSGDGPALDWLAYEDVVETRDRLLQESVGFYDPSMQVIVFVFLPSKSGNSLAMWRRKVAVPNSVRLAHLREIELAKAALRRDYPVFVDDTRSPPYRPSSLQTHSSPPSTKKKKKKGFFRRLFRIFKIVW